MKKHIAACVLFCLLVATRTASAQDVAVDRLDQTFSAIFDKVLTEDFYLSPGAHADHYHPAADAANQALAPALNSLLTSNIASFPLSSTVAGITFDFSGGQPVRVVESLGPIFAETGQMLGARKITIGFNASHLGLDNFRNVDLEDLEFAFLHEDVGEPGLGTDASELDVVHVRMGLDVTADIFAFFASYGVSQNLDVGVAIPFVNISVDGTARATIDSYTMPSLGVALHFFGGDLNAPTLQDEFTYEGSAKGIGDIALRFKYGWPLQGATSVATLLDVRLPTGDEENFLGTGATSARLVLIGSRRFGAFTPHLNVGYDYRGADFDSDELEFAIGFDQKVSDALTFAVDVLGELDLDSGEAIHLPTGTETIRFTHPTSGGTALRFIPLSNVEDRDQDHVLRTAVGFRVAPTERMQLLANLLITMMDSGLYDNVMPTVGFSVLL